MTDLAKDIASISDAVSIFTAANEKKTERLATENRELKERIELLEANGSRPRGTGNETSKYTREQIEHKSVFTEWLRSPHDGSRTGRLTEAQVEMAQKDVSIGTPAGGGYALPKQISDQIELRIQQQNPFRQLVRVDQAGTNDYHALVSLGDSTAGWVSETGTRTATLTPNLRDRAPTFGENYALLTATQWSLDDLFFNVERWLIDETSAQFSAMEATAIWNGNGTARPTGLINAAPVTTLDDASPMRPAAALKYVPFGAYTSPVTITYKGLVDICMDVKEKYLASSQKVAWVMARTTLAAVRKLVDTTGQPIFQPSMILGTPATLLGYPVYTSDSVSSYAFGNYVLAFGAWDHGYVLVDRIPGPRIVVDPYTVPGKVNFYINRRVGGCVLNNDALRVMKYAQT